MEQLPVILELPEGMDAEVKGDAHAPGPSEQRQPGGARDTPRQAERYEHLVTQSEDLEEPRPQDLRARSCASWMN
ncbi:MAG: hypothetical protein R2838_19410 [Caldilineaceae bacterium]